MSDDRPAPRRRGRRLRAFVALLLLAVFAGAWTGLYGVFELAEGEVALVSRAGEFVRRVDGPGRFVHWPFPVERRAVLSKSPQAIPERRVSMLTRDTQLITGVLRGRYRIADAEAARFGVLDAVDTVGGVLQAALLDRVAETDHETLLSRPRSAVAAALLQEAGERLAALTPGLELAAVDVEFTLPDAVTALENEIETLRTERDRQREEIQREIEEVLADARVSALERLEAAKSAGAAQVAKARGEAERFRVVAEEYLRAPELVRTRIYLETMEEILGKARVVIAAPGTSIPSAEPVAELPSVSADGEATP